MNSKWNANKANGFEIIAVTMVGWSGCSNESQIPATATSWGMQYGYAAANTSTNWSYYAPSGSLSFGTGFAFDTTGKLLWTGSCGQITQTMITNWIAAGGGGGPGGGPNNPPVANAGADSSVFEGQQASLSGNGSTDPDGDPLAYSWAQISGPTINIQGANTVAPSFIAPQVGGPTPVTIRLTVNDGNGGTDTDDVVVTINPMNFKPDARAGADFGAVYSSSVQLDGSASSDPDGDPITFLWSQVSGEFVSLSNPGIATPTFTAPAGNGTLVFELRVQDSAGLFDTDRVTVHVNALGVIPPSLGNGAGGGGGGGCVAAGGAPAVLAVFGMLGMLALRRRRN